MPTASAIPILCWLLCDHILHEPNEQPLAAPESRWPTGNCFLILGHSMGYHKENYPGVLIPVELHCVFPFTSVAPAIANPRRASSSFSTGLPIKRGLWTQPSNQYRSSQAKSHELLSPRMLFTLLEGYFPFFLRPHSVCVHLHVHICPLLLGASVHTIHAPSIYRDR